MRRQLMFKKLAVVLIFLAIATGAFAAGNPIVLMKTSMGNVEIELFQDKAPATVVNFLSYVNSGFYNGTIFHRVIGNFMIQGGGFTPGMGEKKTLPPVKNEAANGISNLTGTVAMARTMEPQSATAQFFINVADNRFLDYKSPTTEGYGYCVFGRVVKGMDVVERIKRVQTGNKGYFQDVPLQDVVIYSISKK
jgi:cyclophilin family peptidyl-prolyl cis-trans isomerase